MSQSNDQRAAAPGLHRGIGQWALVALLLNLFIGAGIFGLPARAFALADTYSLLALLVCGGLIALIVLCFLEVGSRFPATGGPYLYALRTFGPLVGFQVGWLMWLTRVTSFAIICDILLSYLGYLWIGANQGATRTVLVTVVVLTITAINHIGVRHAALASSLLAIAKLVPLVLFVAVGLTQVDVARLDFSGPPAADSFALAVMALVFAFAGFEVATINTGEIREPGRTFPRAIAIALGFVVIFYLLIQTVAIGTLPDLASAERPLADAAVLFIGPLGAAMIAVGAVVSTTGTLTAGLLGGSRLPFAMADEQQAPRVLASTHSRFHTPHVALWLTAGAAWVATLTYNFVEALTINSVIRLLTYAAVCAALPMLRRREPTTAPATFSVRAGGLVAVGALLLCAWLLTRITVDEVLQVAGAMLLGLLLHIGYQAIRRARR